MKSNKSFLVLSSSILIVFVFVFVRMTYSLDDLYDSRFPDQTLNHLTMILMV